MKQDPRFVEVHREGSTMKYDGRRHIFVDKETGVHYLVWTNGYAGGITPLLDESGKPIIKK